MAEHPIIFQDWGIRAVRAGTKTQTRRIVIPQPVHYPDRDNWQWVYGAGRKTTISSDVPPDIACPIPSCPYGVGDTLWTKETFVIEDTDDYGPPDPLPQDRPVKVEGNDIDGGIIYLIPHYRATEPEPHIVPFDRIDEYDDSTRWRPSIFMPRWASRDNLTVKSVRVERVQDITADDAIADGVVEWRDSMTWEQSVERFGEVQALAFGACPVECYACAWDSINAKPRARCRGGEVAFYESFPWGWDGERRTEEYRGKPYHIYPNPWVRRIEFERAATN